MTDSKILLETGTNEVEFLEFTTGNMLCGVNVAKVRQVVVFDPTAVSPIPGDQKRGVLGTTLFREKPIMVVELGSFLNIEPNKDRDDSRQLLLALEFNQRLTGFVVDHVDRIRRVSWNEFSSAEESGTVTEGSWITGTVTIDGRIMMILDFEAILGQLIPSASIEAHSVSDLTVDCSRDINIIYCEDSDIVRKVALKALHSAGFRNVRVFPTGKDGLDFIQQNGPDCVDMLITDIEMPEMDGLTLCRNLKDDSRFSELPVVFFSSTINEEMRRKCHKVGGSGSYAKPEINELILSFQDLVR